MFFSFTGVASSVSIFSSIWYLFLVSVGLVWFYCLFWYFSSRKQTGLSEVIPLCGVLPSFPLFVQFECWWADRRSLLLFNIILHGLRRFRPVLRLNRSVQFWRGLVRSRFRCPLIPSILSCEGLYISGDFSLHSWNFIRFISNRGFYLINKASLITRIKLNKFFHHFLILFHFFLVGLLGSRYRC